MMQGNLRGESGLSFTLCSGYGAVAILVANCTFGFGAIIGCDLRTLSLPRELPLVCSFTIMRVLCSPRRKGNSRLLGRPSYEKIQRNNNSAPYLTPRWPLQQILPLNFFCMIIGHPYFTCILTLIYPPYFQC